MTRHRTPLGPLFFSLLCISTMATAQQRNLVQVEAKQSYEARRTGSPAMQRMAIANARKKRNSTQTTALTITAVATTEDQTRTAASPQNGHFESSGTAALIPVSRAGWHEISGWREIRRAQPAR